MKLIIAGSRTIMVSPTFINELLMEFDIQAKIDEVASGCARGVDGCGEAWAQYWERPIKDFPADWDGYGKSAGPIRNKKMAEYADALLLIWDGESKGSDNMKRSMILEGKPIYEVILRRPK